MNERYTAPILATGATGASLSTWIADAHAVLGLAVTVLTLAWWIRLWLKNPNIKPPPRDENDLDRKN